MNRYLMLSAAALFAGTTCAGAGTYCFGFNSVGASAFCDGGELVTGAYSGALQGSVRAWIHINNNCMGGTSHGMGILGKTKDFGDFSTMSDNFYAKNYGDYSLALQYALPKKILDGQPFSIWVEIAGMSAFEADSGVLFGVGKGKCKGGRPPGHGRASTLSGLKAILEARRGEKG